MDTTNGPTVTLTFTPNRHFYVGFFLSLSFLIAINIGSYFLSHDPGDPKAGVPSAHEVGFPKAFWIIGRPYARHPNSSRQDLLAPGFYWGRFLADFAVVLVFSVLAGEWNQRRKTRSASPQQGRA